MNRCTGMALDDLMSLGHETFMSAAESWDPRRARFSTWFRRRLRFEFLKEAERAHRRRRLFREGIPESITHVTPATVACIRDMISGMGDEARTVVSIVLSGPAEILEEIDGTGIAAVRSALRRWCRRQGWTHAKVRETMTEIKQAMEVA